MARENNFWTMRVLPGDRELITALAQREGVPAAQAVRNAIRKVLTENEPRSKSNADVAEARSFISGA